MNSQQIIDTNIPVKACPSEEVNNSTNINHGDEMIHNYPILNFTEFRDFSVKYSNPKSTSLVEVFEAEIVSEEESCPSLVGGGFPLQRTPTLGGGCVEADLSSEEEQVKLISSFVKTHINKIMKFLPEETVVSPFIMTRTTDECVHLLGSGQDVVYKTKKSIDENITEWTLALFDGHGSVKGINPFTKMYEPKFNFTLAALDEMIKTTIEGTDKTILDAILEKDIFSDEDDPAIEMQRALGRACIDKNYNMRSIGSTMVLVKVRHDKSERKITVEVLSVGDSVAVIYQNGKKVLETTVHNSSNRSEIERLIRQERLSSYEPTVPSGNFEVIDEKHLCSKQSLYANFKGMLLASTQSIGHIDYMYGKILDPKGVTGLEPFKAVMEFSDRDEINIKLFSDGVTDVMNETVIAGDREFMISSSATETANFAKQRWEQDWKVCKKADWTKFLEEGVEPTFNIKPTNFGIQKNADDISCVSWIQKKDH